MSAQSFEVTLARLYTDSEFRELFLRDPALALEECQLSNSEKEDLMKMDRAGLILAARSFSQKRQKRISKRKRSILRFWS